MLKPQDLGIKFECKEKSFLIEIPPKELSYEELTIKTEVWQRHQ